MTEDLDETKRKLSNTETELEIVRRERGDATDKLSDVNKARQFLKRELKEFKEKYNEVVEKLDTANNHMSIAQRRLHDANVKVLA